MVFGNFNFFYFSVSVAGIEHNYCVIMRDDHYELDRDGEWIADLVHDTEWQQLSGVPLPGDFIQNVGNKIESYFD